MSTAPLRTPAPARKPGQHAPGPKPATPRTPGSRTGGSRALPAAPGVGPPPTPASPTGDPHGSGPGTAPVRLAPTPGHGSVALSAAPRPARAPFVLVVVALLGAGLIALLLLNTVLAQNAFRLHDLQASTARLADEESELGEQVANGVSPVVLARQAAALGMVPGSDPTFRRLADGRLLGMVTAGPVPQPPGPSPSASASAGASAGAGGAAIAGASPSAGVGAAAGVRARASARAPARARTRAAAGGTQAQPTQGDRSASLGPTPRPTPAATGAR